MSELSLDLPAEFTFGKVVGLFILAVADGPDENRLPDANPAAGSITFIPKVLVTKTSNPVATVIAKPLTFELYNGSLVTRPGEFGVWLIAGQYRVNFSVSGASLPSIDIEVLPSHNAITPLDLTNALPPGGPILTPSEYSILSGRIDAFEAGGGGGGGGTNGTDGADGASAYEVAVANGFVGTEAQWLTSLEGADGNPGIDGTDGASAYEVAVANGFVGTEAQWLASLQGEDGVGGGGSLTVPATVQSGSTYTIAASDNLSTVIMTNATGPVVTVPTEAVSNLGDGFKLMLHAAGEAGLSLDLTGITPVGSPSVTECGPDEGIYLEKTSALGVDTWLVQAGATSGTIPATTVLNETALNGSAQTVGTSLNYAREDHSHGTPPMPSASDVGALAKKAATNVTSTAYTLVSDDENRTRIATDPDLVTITLPTDVVDPLPIGVYRVFAAGVGGVTTATAGITLIGSAPEVSIPQNKYIVYEKVSENAWIIGGGMA